MARLRDEIRRQRQEAEWLTTDSTSWLHDVLEGLGIRSERKSRLLACAHCRSFWQLLTDQRCQAAVEAAERVADGSMAEGDLRPFYGRVRAVNAELTADRNWVTNPTVIRRVKAT